MEKNVGYIRDDIMDCIMSGLLGRLSIHILRKADVNEIFHNKTVYSGKVASPGYENYTYKVEECKGSDNKISINSNGKTIIYYQNEKNEISNIIKTDNRSDENIILRLDEYNRVSKAIVRDKYTNNNKIETLIEYNGRSDDEIKIEYKKNLEKITINFLFKFDGIKFTCINKKYEDIDICWIYEKETDNILHVIKRKNDIIIESTDIEDKIIKTIRDGLMYEYNNENDILEIHDQKTKSLIKKVIFNNNNLTTSVYDYIEKTKTQYSLPFIKEQGATKIITVTDTVFDTIINKKILYYNGTDYKLQYEYEYESQVKYTEKFHSYCNGRKQHRINVYLYDNDNLVSQNVYMYDINEKEFVDKNTFLISYRNMITQENGEIQCVKKDVRRNKTYNSNIVQNERLFLKEIEDENIDLINIE